MQYMLLLYVNEAGWPQMTPAQQSEGMAAYMAYTEALSKAGAFVSTNRLGPSSAATTVRLQDDGKRRCWTVPYADSKEQLGGYYIIEAPDLDAALAWAARCPAADHGIVEVRPIHPV